jgi:hypothetical protein
VYFCRSISSKLCFMHCEETLEKPNRNHRTSYLYFILLSSSYYLSLILSSFPLPLSGITVSASTAMILASASLLGYDPSSDTSLVECRPITGRTHQLRLHLQSKLQLCTLSLPLSLCRLHYGPLIPYTLMSSHTPNHIQS